MTSQLVSVKFLVCRRASHTPVHPHLVSKVLLVSKFLLWFSSNEPD